MLTPEHQRAFLSIPAVRTLVGDWSEKQTVPQEMIRQIQDRICERGKQVVGFLHLTLTADTSIHSYYGKRFLTIIGGGQGSDLDIEELSKFGSLDPLMRDVFATIERRVAAETNTVEKIADLSVKTKEIPGRNEEQCDAYRQKVTSRINGLIHLLRDQLRGNEQWELAGLLRYAGGEPRIPQDVRRLVEAVVHEHPYGSKILGSIEQDMLYFGVNVNPEIEPLMTIMNEIRSGGNFPLIKSQS